MSNSQMDLSGENNIVCNNTATSRAADIFLNSTDDTIELFDASLMCEEYRDRGRLIDGWYADSSARYEPKENASSIDYTKTQKGTRSLVASYRIHPEAIVSYDLDGGLAVPGTTYSSEIIYLDSSNMSITVKSAPVKSGYTFIGWSDGTNVYQPGDPLTITQDVVLKAVWSKDKSDVTIPENPGNKPDDNGNSSNGNNTNGNNANTNNNVSSISDDHGSDGSITDSSLRNNGKWNLISNSQDQWTYTDGNGTVLKDSWAKLSNPYAEDDQPQTAWFHFDAEGNMDTGWYLDPKTGDWYMLHDDSDGMLGSMRTGWYNEDQDGKWYYLDKASGKMLLGWQYIDEKWYYFNSYAPESTWEHNGEVWVYNGSSYKPYGSMYNNEMTPDGYYVDATGAWDGRKK